MSIRTHDVIESYVLDVMRRVPARERNDVGLELRGLLTEMLADRAEAAGVLPDDAMVLAMLREFGAPTEVAARYQPPGFVIIPAEQSRWFAVLSLGGVGLQWALTLPGVFQGQTNVTQWWFTWGLGSLWWPGFLVMTALVAAWYGQLRTFKPMWKPRDVDSERVNRKALGFGLFWFAIAVALLVSLPFMSASLPGALPQVFAFDADFLRVRAPWALPLWLGHFALLLAVWRNGRWTPRMRRIELALALGFLALLSWWLAAGPMFGAPLTDEGARGAIALVIVIIVLDLANTLFRLRTRLSA